MQKSKNNTKIAFQAGFVAILLLFLMLILTGCSQETQITIQGECGEVMGTLMNRIENQEDCRVQCRNECFAIEKELSRSLFVQKENTRCNSCDCYCK